MKKVILFIKKYFIVLGILGYVSFLSYQINFDYIDMAKMSFINKLNNPKSKILYRNVSQKKSIKITKGELSGNTLYIVCGEMKFKEYLITIGYETVIRDGKYTKFIYTLLKGRNGHSVTYLYPENVIQLDMINEKFQFPEELIHRSGGMIYWEMRCKP